MSDARVNSFNNLVLLDEQLSNQSKDLYNLKEDLVSEVVRLIELISDLYSLKEELTNEITTLTQRNIKTGTTRKTNYIRRIK